MPQACALRITPVNRHIEISVKVKVNMRNLIEKMDGKWAWQSRLVMIAVAVLFVAMGEIGHNHQHLQANVTQQSSSR